jgi:hypothetical protein
MFDDATIKQSCQRVTGIGVEAAFFWAFKINQLI